MLMSVCGMSDLLFLSIPNIIIVHVPVTYHVDKLTFTQFLFGNYRSYLQV